MARLGTLAVYTHLTRSKRVGLFPPMTRFDTLAVFALMARFYFLVV